MTLKIAFYGHPLLNNNKTGIGYCEDGLLRGLLTLHPQQEYLVDIFTSGEKEKKRQSIRDYGETVKISECGWISERVFKLLSLVVELPYIWFFREKRDITHFCNYVVPLGVRGKKVVTVHDLAFREFPETVRGRTMVMLKRNLKRSLRRADAIVTVSEFTKKELMKYYDIASEKIAVVPNGVDTAQYHLNYSSEQIQGAKKKYSIEGSYFLYLGTLEPRKNLRGLLLAYKKFYEERKDTGKEIPKLVLAGGKGWMYDEIFQTAEEISLKDHVIFTGYVDDQDKAPLMCGASVFCFPSLYEGFGMPPLESMACGTPVLTSNNSSLKEVTEDAAIQVDPYDLDQMAQKMAELCDNNDLGQQLRERGIKQAEKYSWSNAVEKLWEVYQRVAGEPVYEERTRE